jgi:hypothetical protein
VIIMEKPLMGIEKKSERVGLVYARRNLIE